MKRILLLLAAGAAAISLNAGQPASGIAGSYHDMNTHGVTVSKLNNGVTAATTETCVYCHLPHIATTTTQLVPLWNHATTSQATFTMYNALNAKSDASNILLGVDTSPTGVSLACISCHDGSVAISATVDPQIPYKSTYTNAGQVSFGSTIINPDGTVAASYLLKGKGGDFTSDHPISVTYDATKDLGLKAPDTGTSQYFGGKTTVVGTYLPLFSGKVQCGSCHDVHNYSKSLATGQGGAPFLRIDNGVGSALCIACHKK